MRENPLTPLTAPVDATILDTLTVIERGGLGICCLVDAEHHMVGVVTDGDVRRAIIQRADLDEPALPHATRNPYTVPSGTPRASVLDLMRSLRINAVPELGPDGRLVSVHTLAEMVGARGELPNAAVIMAGGRGTRLGKLTKATPKPLMLVAGRPIIEWVILNLIGSGISNIYVSVNYLADQIVEHLGTGAQFGARIEYLRETPTNPLGTAGSLSLLPAAVTEPGQPPLFVLNGDLIVDFNPREMLSEHTNSGAALTIATKTYEHQVPFGVVALESDGTVSEVTEKPTISAEINAAIYCLEPSVVRLLAYDQPGTMPDLVQQCIDLGKRVIAWPILTEWMDVGNPQDLARAQGKL